jgi:hypothetical protein
MLALSKANIFRKCMVDVLCLHLSPMGRKGLRAAGGPSDSSGVVAVGGRHEWLPVFHDVLAAAAAVAVAEASALYDHRAK